MTHKLRATEKITGVQVPVDEILFNRDGSINCIVAYGAHEGYGVCRFDPEELNIAEFTGRYDKNKTPIYEHDTVRVSKPNSYLDGDYEVRWNNDYSMWGYHDGNGFVTKGNGQPYIIGQHNCEVI